MGVTSTGLRYPEPTEPVAQGAAAMKDLADDLTAKYTAGAATSIGINPWGGAVPAGKVPIIVAGIATLTFDANGRALFNLPTPAYAGVLSCLCSSAGNANGLPDAAFMAVLGLNTSQLSINAKRISTGAALTGVQNFQYVAVAWR